MIQNGLAQLRRCVSVAYTNTPLLLCFRVMQLFSSALNRVVNQLSDVHRCGFQIADSDDRTGQRFSFRQLLKEGFNQGFPLLEGEALGCGDKLVNGHCVYSFSSGIHRIEYNTLLGVKGDPFLPQTAKEDTAANALDGLQRRAEPIVSQPKLNFDTTA